MAASTESRFVKLSPAGGVLDVTAPDWAAVLDRETQLIWTRDSLSCGEVNWKRAQKEAAAVTLLGATDWRLPTRKELLTLVDDTHCSPAIDTDFFTCHSSWYWTSTPAAFSAVDYAWYVNFDLGLSLWSPQGNECFVRAVRPSQ